MLLFLGCRLFGRKFGCLNGCLSLRGRSRLEYHRFCSALIKHYIECREIRLYKLELSQCCWILLFHLFVRIWFRWGRWGIWLHVFFNCQFLTLIKLNMGLRAEILGFIDFFSNQFDEFISIFSNSRCHVSPAAISELIQSQWHVFAYLKHYMIWHHIPDWLILNPSYKVTPLKNTFKSLYLSECL